jgi:putative tryptophan/tyrosine transport system substrate-binding protein
MTRRAFIALLGSAAAAWPLAARAQQPAMPVIGFLNRASADGYRPMVAAFRQDLQEIGYVEGRTVAIEYRFAGNRNERLPALAADLVQRQVTVIAATTTPAALAAKAATTTIQLGLVANLNRPGGNVTGVTQLSTVVAAKRLELLHELVPTATVMALLIDPTDPALAEAALRASQAAAQTLGLSLRVLNASTESDFDGVFANVIQLRAGGLVIASNAFFWDRIEQLAALAVRHAVPTVHAYREFVAAGGLASYGGSITDSYRVAGGYTGRILKGEKPADLPVQQGTKVELYINLKTAKALGITVPLPLSGRAEELIE